MAKRKVLILSGGGCKGVLQVEILKELEKRGELNDLSLIVGSSVGAINGTILASGKLTAQQLRDTYPDMLKEIFKKKLFSFIPPIYDRNNFVKVWQKLIGSMKMKELKVPMVISTIDFCKKESHFFKSYKDTNVDEDVLTVVQRSFAAPYYFGFLPDSTTQRVYGDGGMSTDNLPIVESILETIGLDWMNDEVKLIIIGTGFVDISEPFDKASKENFIQQIFDYMNPGDGGLARAMSRTNQLGQLKFITNTYSNIHYDYYDIQIPKSLDKMDALNYITQYQQFGLQASLKPLITG